MTHPVLSTVPDRYGAPRVRAIGDLPWIEDATAVAPLDARALSRIFFDRLDSLEEGTHAYQYARNTLIELNLSLVRFAAGRFRNRGDEREDVVQVGTVGLIKAIDRFDLSREVEFTSFAIPYIVGEIKRFFRDTSWAVHVPRRLQELRIRLAKADETLSRKLSRAPTTAELARHLGTSESEVTEGLVAANGYNTVALDAPLRDNDHSHHGSQIDRLGAPDPALATVEDLETLKPLLEELGERDRRILEMRYGEELTQAQIGARLGISQMQVSRLLTRTLRSLRDGMLTES